MRSEAQESDIGPVKGDAEPAPGTLGCCAVDTGVAGGTRVGPERGSWQLDGVEEECRVAGFWMTLYSQREI